ncbi:MAG: EamA family transporter [Alphaproteobacteria bacterium HGW-Alphaproteobacteria-4]|nr:MAG: EamA family transporter [Alphaproteobacteria bacterium HGW-Alphaproteobacteria-4]
MRLLALTTLTMIAFAANSVLNRLGVGGGLIDPIGFALVRLLAGAATLAALWAMRSRRHAVSGTILLQPARRALGAASLLVYLFGFSLAYGVLDAGAGALILFGWVQITMFAGAVLARERVPARRWAGAALAFAGLLVLLAPGGGTPLGWHAAAMALAGIGWGVYSLAGRGERDALAATAANFMVAAPFGLALALVLPGAVGLSLSGVALAIASGALASGLGYALWYSLLPQLGAARAAVAQLSVPLIAAAGGAALIGEAVSWRFGAAAALVLGGVALAVMPGSRR